MLVTLEKSIENGEFNSILKKNAMKKNREKSLRLLEMELPRN